MRTLLQSAAVILGPGLVAFALNAFFLPHALLTGGLSGVALLLSHAFGWSLGLQVLVYNIPILWWAQKFLGRKFLILTVVAIGVMTAALSLIPVRPFITDDPLLNAIFGGILFGMGVGITFRSGGSLGGIDPLLVALNRRYSLPMGDVMLLFNGIIVGLAGLQGDLKVVLYTIVAMFASGKLVDLITSGTVKKTVMIITSHPTEVAHQINRTMVRGVTVVDGKGAYSGESRSVLLCVLTRYELSQIKEIVQEADPAAFLTILDTDEVMGRFRDHNPLIRGLKTVA